VKFHEGLWVFPDVLYKEVPNGNAEGYSTLAGFFHVCSPFPSLLSLSTHKELSLEQAAAFGLLAVVAT